MDQDQFMAEVDFTRRDLSSLVDEFEVVRKASLFLVESFTEADWQRTGTASGGQFTLKANAYIVAGHELHHLGILNSRYGIDV